MSTSNAFIRSAVPAIQKILLVASATFTAQASADQPGWYAELVGGIGFQSDADLTGTSPGEASFEPGLAGGAAAGYDFGSWQLEAEYLYQTSDTNKTMLDGPLANSSGGDYSAVVVSLNAIKEFNLLSGNRARSYAGLGVAWLQEVDIDFTTDAGEQSFSGSDVGLNLLAGVRYRLSDRWSASLEARFVALNTLNLKGEGSNAGEVGANYDRTSALLSLRYRF